MKFSRRLISAFTLSLFFFMAGCMGPSSRDSNAATGQRPAGRLGNEQMFTLKNLNGEDVSLETLLKANKAVLLNFWATWCPPCREEIPHLIKLQETYQGRSFTILGVDVGESDAKVSGFVKKIGINYPVVLDRDNGVAGIYGIVGIPTSMLIGSDGKILGVYYGFTRQLTEDVKKAVENA